MTIYTSQSISGYNSNPPSDDGQQVSDNEITWAKHKTKLADPVKTLTESINSELVTAFGKVFLNTTSTLTTNTTLSATHHGKILRVSNGPTLALTAAATLGNGWNCIVFNADGTPITIDPNGSETINGAATFTVDSQYDYVIITCDGTDFVAAYNDIYTVDGTTAKTTLVTADTFGIADSAASDVNKKITYGNVKTQLQTDLVATTSAVGFVELATAAEVLAETSGKIPDAALLINHPGVCKAWVMFDQTGTLTVKDSYNVTSVSDDGTAESTVTFATDFASANYAVAGWMRIANGGTNTTGMLSAGTTQANPTAGACPLKTWEFDGTTADFDYVSAVFFGGQ